jgi:hypothetical protein
MELRKNKEQDFEEFDLLTKDETNRIEKLSSLSLKGFVVARCSVFDRALQTKADSVNFMLLDTGFSIAQAIVDALNSSKPAYAIKMLKRADRVRQDPNSRLLFHALAKNLGNMEPAQQNAVFGLIAHLKADINYEDA